jgi:hypothetical protein
MSSAVSHGKFTGEPQTRWLTEAGPDRSMEVLADFAFTDPAHRRWAAPAGSVVDGASIPRPLWTLVGSPYTGDYRRASIVHDVACVDAGGDTAKRRAADRMFFHACRAGGCDVREAMILYLGVRIGAIWPAVPQWEAARATERDGPRLNRLASEERLETDFRNAAEAVLARGEVDDAEELERRADKALSAVMGLDVSRL